MNTYQFHDLSVGMSEEFKVVLTEDMMDKFREITDDVNPLHTDEKYAKSKGYGQCVSYGMLTASFLSTLGGVYLPGEHCLIQSVETKFLNPVFVGDQLTVKGTVSKLHESVQRADIQVTITNQKNEKVLRGEMKVGVLK